MKKDKLLSFDEDETLEQFSQIDLWFFDSTQSMPVFVPDCSQAFFLVEVLQTFSGTPIKALIKTFCEQFLALQHFVGYNIPIRSLKSGSISKTNVSSSRNVIPLIHLTHASKLFSFVFSLGRSPTGNQTRKLRAGSYSHRWPIPENSSIFPKRSNEGIDLQNKFVPSILFYLLFIKTFTKQTTTELYISYSHKIKHNEFLRVFVLSRRRAGFLFGK